MRATKVMALNEQSSSDVRESAPSRIGAGLCLSGGGYRATLFHLGALRRLNECGLLGWFDTIVSVSGGSFTLAQVAKVVSPWPKLGEVFPNWEERVAAPLRAFCEIDVRTPAVWRGLTRPFQTWNEGGFPATVVEEAVHRLLHSGTLDTLPSHPRIVIQASDVDRGTLFRFEHDRIYRAGRKFSLRPEDTVARAVAASACFPPVFAPIHASKDPTRFKSADDSSPDFVPLSDGGLYDNLGLQPVMPKHKYIFISDAGSPWDYSIKPRGLLGLMSRYPSVLMRQVQNLRMREWINLRDNQWIPPERKIGGVWWSLTNPPPLSSSHQSAPFPRPCSYPDEFLSRYVAKCRTDLNSFSRAEAAVLENAGYAHCAITLEERFAPLPGWPPAPPPQWPHPRFGNPDEAAPHLEEIAERMPGGWRAFVDYLFAHRELPAHLP